MQDNLSQTFAALADPTRRAMLARLSQGEASVSELAEPFLDEMSLPAVTKHLKVLERAGLVTKTRQAQWRPCKLNGEPLRDAADWMERYRAFWEESFDRLDAYLKTVTAKKQADEKENAKANAQTKAQTKTRNSSETKGKKDARTGKVK
jgi:DNA-binding transcriptional ArsR family regulator